MKMITRIASATATLNELREVIKATTEQNGTFGTLQIYLAGVVSGVFVAFVLLAHGAERSEVEKKWLHYLGL